MRRRISRVSHWLRGAGRVTRSGIRTHGSYRATDLLSTGLVETVPSARKPGIVSSAATAAPLVIDEMEFKVLLSLVAERPEEEPVDLAMEQAELRSE